MLPHGSSSLTLLPQSAPSGGHTHPEEVTDVGKSYAALVDAGIANPWHLASKAHLNGVGPGVYLAYRHASAAPDWRTNGWTLADVTDRSRITHFPATDVDEGTALARAIACANERYGTTQWATVPGCGRNLFPVEVVEYASQRVQSRPAASRVGK